MAKKYWWEDENQQDTQKSEAKSHWWEDSSVSSTVGTNITNRVNTWLKNHNTYISNYQTRNSGRKYNYEDSYVSDSADWLNAVSQQKSAFDAEADSILSYMDQYKDYLDADWMSSVRKTLTEARSAQDIVLGNTKKDNEWWSSFGSEEMLKAHGSAEEAYKYYQWDDGLKTKYTGATGDDILKALDTLGVSDERDWLKLNQGKIFGDTIRGDTAFQDYATIGSGLSYTDFGTETRHRGTSRRQRSTTSIDKYRAASLALAEHYGNEAPLGTYGQYDAQVAIFRTMDDKEFENLAYCIAYDKENGTNTAEQYVNLMEETLSNRRGTDIGEKITGIDIPVIEDLAVLGYGALAGVDNFAFGIEQFVSDDEVAYYPSYYANAHIADSLDGLGYYAHSAATNIGNMAPSILVSGVASGLGVPSKVSEAIGSTTMGVSAAGGAYKEALAKGYDKESARTYSNLVGASEGLLQYLIGGVSKLGGVSNISSKLAGKISLIDDALLRGAAKYGMSIGSEIFEEEIQNFLEPAFRSIIFGEDYDAPTINEMIETAIVTALSTGVLEGGSTYTGIKEDIALDKQAAKDYGDKTDALIQEGLQNDVKSASNKLAQKYQKQTQGKDGKGGKAMTGSQIRNLLAANQAEVTKADLGKIQDAAANRLAQVGQREDIYKIAELATKYATGQEMTRAERSTLARSNYGSQVASEMLNGIHPDKLLSNWENNMSEESGAEYSTDWTGEIDTESDQFIRFNNKKLARAIFEHLANSVVEDPAAYKSLESRVEAEEPAQVSDTGKSVIHGTDQEIDLTKPTFKEITKKGAVLEADGKLVSANNIDYADENLGYAIRSVGKIENITPEAAGAVVSLVDMSKPVVAQMNAMDEAFSYGYNNYSVEDLKAGLFTKNLTDAQLNDAYKLGQYVRGKTVVDADAPVVKMRTALDAKLTAEQKTAQQKARIESKDVEVYFKDGGTVVKFDEHTGKYDPKRMAAVNTAKFLSKLKIGGKYYFYESYENAAGERVYKDADGNEVAAPNGMYMDADGSIHIDLNAGNDGQGTALFTLGHELTHFVKGQSKKQFKILGDLVKEAFDKTDMSMHKRVLEKQRFLESVRRDENGNKVAVSYEEAYEEVVADAMSTMLTDGSFHEKLMEIKVKDKGLFNTIKRFFEDMIAKFKKVYEELTPDQQDAQDIRELKDMFDKIQTAFAEALVEASDNFQATDGQKNTTQKGDVREQARPSAKNPNRLDPRSVTREDVRVLLQNAEAGLYAENTYIPVRISTPGIVQERLFAEDLPMAMPVKKVKQEFMPDLGPVVGKNVRGHELTVDELLYIIEMLDSPDYLFSQADGRGVAVLSLPGSPVRKTVIVDFGQNINASYMNGYDGDKYNISITAFDIDGGDVGLFMKQLEKGWNKVFDKQKEGDPAKKFQATRPFAIEQDTLTENVSQPETKVNTESTEAMDVEVDAKTESVAPSILKSERTWTSSDYVQERDKAAKEIAKAIGVSEQKAKDYIDSINSIAKMIAEDRSRLDYFSSPGRTSFVGNVEYGGSFDFSTLCKKRRLLTGTFTAIQKALPNTALTADEILDIRNRMKEANLEVSCGLCYVEGSRANMGQFAKEFLRLYKQYYPDAWQPNMADVNTPDGIEWVRINHPEVYEQYEYFWNHYGTLKEGDKNLFASQQKPKLYQLHTEYKSEILDKFNDDDNVEEKNLNGGIRLQSFSDFEIVHLIDTMQIIMDMSRVGLAGQAYTKVPDFAWALGDTGLKINLSLIAKGVDADGKLIFDDVEGMPIAEAMKLRDRYSKNVGTILVAFNDEQLLAAMADDRVDFIIPFHRSQWKKSQYEAMGLPAKTKDYTFMQNEKYIKPQFHEYRGRMVKDKATNYMPNEYWDFSKSGKENAEAYLEMCARNNKRPKFYKLLQNNGDGSYSLKPDGSTDGYWKLLIDFKMYDNDGNGSPQMPVKPDFNMEEATRMLNDYNGGHSNFPVAQGIVDSFVKEYKASHKGQKLSERYSPEVLFAKDPLVVATFPVRDIPTKRKKVNLPEIVKEAKKGTGTLVTAGQEGIIYKQNYVYISDIDRNVLINTRGINHGITGNITNSSTMSTAEVERVLPAVLRNSIAVNELSPREEDRDKGIVKSYVLFGYARRLDGQEYLVRSTVNHFDHNKSIVDAVEIYDVLKGLKAKKLDSEVIGSHTGNPAARPLNTTKSNYTISVKDLLGIVKDNYPEYLPDAFRSYYGVTDPKEKGLIYSERGEGTSNRHLLANAFEGLSRSSAEYKMIQDYKEQIKVLNLLDEQLSDLNAEIREIRFTKGKYDAEKLRKIEEKAERIARDIDKQDKVLIRMEASEPLRKVIERERKKEAQKTKDHVKDIQENKKVRAEQTELRHKIRKAIRDLDKILKHGNKQKNVKEDLLPVVTKALQSADILFTDNYGTYDMLRNGIGADLSDAEEALVATCTRMLKDLDKMPTDGYDNFQARKEAERKLSYKMSNLKDVFARERKRLNNIKVSSILGELADAYASLEKSEQSYVQGAYTEAVHNFLKNLQSEVGGTIVKDMTKDQLEYVYAAYKMVLTTVRKANEMFNKELKMSREQLGNAVIQEVMNAGGVHGLWTKAELAASKADWNNMKPIWVANRIGSDTFGKLMQGLFQGQYNFAVDVEEAKQFKLSMDEKYKPRSWDAEKLYEFESSTGKKFSLNLQQIMSLYAFSKREQAYSHLLNGGFVFEGNSTVIVDENGRKKTYIHNGATSYKLNEVTLNEIINSLTKEQKAYVDEMQKYLSEVMGAKGNEVSMQLYGIKMFKEQFYFPLRSSGAYMERAKEAEMKKQQGQINLVNSGFTHAVKPEAKNPIILSGFMDVWAEHCNEMSMYHSMVLPMEDFRKVYNYSTVHDDKFDSASVFQTIQDAYGDAATAYIDQLYRELNAGATIDPRETTFKKLISNFKKTAVMLSASVVVQQFSSIGRAYALIDPKYFIGTRVNSDTQLSVADEMKKYAPVAIIKEMGGFDTGTKGSAKSYIMAEKYGKGEWLQGLKKDEQYRSDLMGILPAKADEKTWCAIWEAVKRETKAKHPKMDVKSEEFLKLAGERFSEVIEKTQVYDSVLARSANMRSKTGLMQMATSFMAEPTTTVNLLEDAIRRGDKKYMARAFGAVAVSIVLNNALASIVYAMRDDDEDETFIEKYFQSFTSGMIDDINPMSYYPFLKDVYSLFQGYDVERADMSVIADLRDALKKAVGLIGKDTSSMDDDQLAEHYKTVNSAILSLLDAGCSVFGVPLKNVRRDANGIINSWNTVGKDLTERDTSWNSFWDKVGAAAKDTIPIFAWTKDAPKTDKLYNAIVSGDKAYLARLKSTYKTDSAYQSAVRKALRENDSRIHDAAQAKYEGRTEEYKRIFRQIQKEGKFSFDDIMSAINSEESKIRNGLEPEKVTSSYTASGFVEAVILGDSKSAAAMREDIISTKVANGKTQEEAEKEFTSAVATGIHDAYSSGLLDEAGAENMLMEYAGKDEEEAASKVNYWAFCDAHPQYELTESNVTDYQEFAEPAEISLDVFVQYINGTKGISTKYDQWGDVELTVREQTLEVIDSLPLTWQQKDALYLAAGYSESKIWDVPW